MENIKKTNIISQVSRFQDLMGSAEAHLELSRTCKMELFEITANGFQMILDVRLVSECAPGLYVFLRDYTNVRYFLSIFTQCI